VVRAQVRRERPARGDGLGDDDLPGTAVAEDLHEQQPDGAGADDRDGVAARHPYPVAPVDRTGQWLRERGDPVREVPDGFEVPRRDAHELRERALKDLLAGAANPPEVLTEGRPPALAGRTLLTGDRRVDRDAVPRGDPVDPVAGLGDFPGALVSRDDRVVDRQGPVVHVVVGHTDPTGTDRDDHFARSCGRAVPLHRLDLSGSGQNDALHALLYDGIPVSAVGGRDTRRSRPKRHRATDARSSPCPGDLRACEREIRPIEKSWFYCDVLPRLKSWVLGLLTAMR